MAVKLVAKMYGAASSICNLHSSLLIRFQLPYDMWKLWVTFKLYSSQRSWHG